MSLHPLDPLTQEEIQRIVQVVRQAHPEPITGGEVQFGEISLREPPKHKVIEGLIPTRYARALVYRRTGNLTTSYLVNITADYTIERVTHPKIIPAMNYYNPGPEYYRNEEGLIGPAVRALLRSNQPHAEEYRTALIRRGIDIRQIGDEGDRRYYPCIDCTFEMYRAIQKDQCEKIKGCCPELIPEDAEGRFFLLVLIDNEIDPVDAYIDGLVAVINVSVRQAGVVGRITKVIDEYIAPQMEVPGVDTPYRTAVPVRPLETTLPQGSSFVLNGREVSFANWKFRLSWDDHSGVQFYDVRYYDSKMDKYRSILYKMSVSDAIVTYHTQKPILLRNFISSDSFSYPLLYRLAPLKLGQDVPDHAQLLSIPLFNPDGSSKTLDNVIGIYEERSDLLWRSVEAEGGAGQVGRDLVIRSIFSGYFYLWIFTWRFSQNGSFEVKVDLAGRTINQILNSNLTQEEAEELGYFGAYVNRNEYGLTHTHIHNFRFDFAIDGLKNSVVETNWSEVPVNDECDNPCGMTIHHEEVTLKSEHEAVRKINPQTGRTWKVENPNKIMEGLEEAHPGYELVVPSMNSTVPVSRCSNLAKQFRFVLDNVFVTKYNNREQHAAGHYPIQRSRDVGLGEYIKEDDPIENEDIVFWFTTLFTHDPHLEDHPSIPILGQKVKWVPHNFFASNPGVTEEPAQ